ncbi:hypothetical protein TCAL_03131 [Tigriopus californicus]|uniref:Transcription initiation factor TFIID subunit 13 n=2 Tax=Tigriopus californicus TaxID=6832 RepID=A0A553P1Q5_TIGCA|nr:hypothetical protein TCAL_03131 [Tigriopus californicus]|eukprot:TCALIF_03131-PA protein Name:"Similar to TAF13 Transcription initiation factor TFIID subunit 13 (Pongo abelii)" AED:0.07 eAED:0.07 QI:0/-1/0/1/-1/1/1/0/143
MNGDHGSSMDMADMDDLDLDGDTLDPNPASASIVGGTLAPDDKRRMFSKELRCMLFGYGDDQNPYTETVDLLEDLVLHFIMDTTQKAMEIGRPGRVQVEDMIFLVRKHPKMYARVRELLTMNEELKKARKAFDEIKYVQGTNP